MSTRLSFLTFPSDPTLVLKLTYTPPLIWIHHHLSADHMAGTGYQHKWLRAGKVLEQIAGGPWDSGGRDVDYQLYQAIMEGEVRARVNGNILTDLSVISSRQWDEENPYALPFDLEVNLEDVERIWNWDSYDLADVIPRGKLGPGTASIHLEVTILNMNTLLRRLSARLPAMTMADAQKEIDFDLRWSKLVRDAMLLRGVEHWSEERRDELLSGLDNVILRRDEIFAQDKQRTPKRRTGRTPKYDWAAADAHIKNEFCYHGPLSADDPEWSCQADVERELQKFFLQKIGQEPAIATVRPKAKMFIAQWVAENS